MRKIVGRNDFMYNFQAKTVQGDFQNVSTTAAFRNVRINDGALAHKIIKYISRLAPHTDRRTCVPSLTEGEKIEVETR